MLKRGQIFIGFFLIFTTNCWAYLPDSALAHEDIRAILKSIPFSTPTYSLIKKLGIQYDKNILAPKRAYSPYKTKYQEALYLGVCQANFRYTSIYGQNEDALSYLYRIQNANKFLHLESIIDFHKIQQLFSHKNNSRERLLFANQGLAQA